MDIFSGSTVNISSSDFFYSGTELFQEVRRESIELIAHSLSHDLLFGIKFKDEGIQDGIFGFLQLNRLHGAGDQFFHLFAQRFNARSSAAALCSHGKARDARMIKGGTHAAAY